MSNESCAADNNLYIPIDRMVEIVGIKGLPIPESLRRQWFGDSPKPVTTPTPTPNPKP